jgi:hypothetical protein
VLSSPLPSPALAAPAEVLGPDRLHFSPLEDRPDGPMLTSEENTVDLLAALAEDPPNKHLDSWP